jgi:two-component system cell cycle sensor histidine kinase/response regulator CckA
MRVLVGDVTDRTAPAGNEDQSAQLLRLIMDAVPAFLAYVDPEYRYRFINRQYERAFGRAGDKILGNRIADLIGEAAFAERRPLLARALSGEPVEFYGKVVLELGTSPREVRVSYVPDVGGDGQTRGIVVLVTDVTQQKRADAALGVYETIVKSLSEGVCLARASDRVIVYANPKLDRMFGYGPGEVVGRRISDIEHDTPATDSPTQELRCRTKDGSLMWCRTSVSTLVHPEHGVVELRVHEDISEQKRIQAKLVLSDRMASVGTLAAGVAHEINNPLSCVTGNLEVLAEEIQKRSRDPDAATSAQLLEIIAEAREAADRVRRIVRDLNTFSRSEEDRRAPIDLHRVLDLSINMASSEIRHRARLEKEYGPVPVVAADEARLGQVFINLLVNAAQALPDGHADQHTIRVVTKTDSLGRAVVEVHDTGPGIPPEILGRIFDPFFTTKPVGVGIGLGLSICHGIVTSLGGEITAESRVGEGSTIRVSLPAAAEVSRGAAAVGGAASTQKVGKRGSILIVDDDELVARSLRRALRFHDVVVARNGREALQHVASGKAFDVILCDLMMPEMTGMQVHAELSRIQPDVAEKMIFITGGAFTPEARSFLDSVSNERLEKPVDMKTLRAVVERMLP